MTYIAALEQDQERIEAQYETIEAIYLSGISDAADGRFPQMSEIVYLQGFCVGMEQSKRIIESISIAAIEQTEFPLLCSQCSYLNNGKCEIKSIPRNSNSYACDPISVDCPF